MFLFVCLFYISTFSWEPWGSQGINNLCKVTEGKNGDLTQGSTIIAFFLPPFASISFSWFCFFCFMELHFQPTKFKWYFLYNIKIQETIFIFWKELR